MNPQAMEEAMLRNMIKKTGKSIEEWICIVNKQPFSEAKNIVQFLKKEYSVGHFYAHLIVKKTIG